MACVMAQFHQHAAIGGLVRMAFALMMVMAIMVVVVMFAASERQTRYENSDCDRFHFTFVV